MNSCADDLSAGTLRKSIQLAVDGDTIDLHSSLSCSTITLAHGEIATSANSLYLDGPDDRTLTIAAISASPSRVLHHTGTSGLYINHLTLTGGKYSSASADAKGGCVYSSGNVVLHSSVISNCAVSALKSGGFPPALAEGAGIYCKNNTVLVDSRISGNNALAFYNNHADGGGVATVTGFRSYSSVISANSALGAGGSAQGKGGGIAAGGNVYIVRSTIDSNQADFSGGINQNGGDSESMVIHSSTISGNTANILAAALYTDSPTVIQNSTIAFNAGNNDGAIVAIANVSVDSSIIARNTTKTAGFADLYIGGSGHFLRGSHDLIVSSNFSLPDLLTSNPLLTPLADHGGPTRTHALLANSPALDQGIDEPSTVGADQRGRSRFVGSAPDIGAYERQINDDQIFYDGFD